MHSRLLKDIDFSRHQRWIDRATGSPTQFFIFARDGSVLWGGEHPQAQALGQAISTTANFTAGLHCHDLDDKSTSLYLSIDTKQQELPGWAAVVVTLFDQDDTPIHIDHLAEALEDLASGVADELRHRTDLEMMTEELGARYEELHLVYSVDQHARSKEGSNQDIFQSLLHSTSEHLNVDVVAYVRPSKDVCQYATSLSQEIHNLDLVLVEMRGDLYRFVQACGNSIVLNANDDPRRSYIFTDMPYKVIACPVQVDGRTDSMVILLNHQHKPDFTNSDRKLAEVLANQLSSLSNTYLLLQSMREFNEQMARALIEAVEAKDPYTRGHSERVHHLSMEIGRALELPDDELDDLFWGSLLHDVGKIGIPDAVLCKPGRLTKDEYTFIMVHPERSYEILRHIKHFDKAVLGARHHQEMFDGKGYPHGLKGEHIPLHGRIIAVADTYDSITSSRAYRAGRSHEIAMSEIQRVAGAQLDPKIVDVFKQIVSREPEWLQRFKIRRDPA